MRRASAKTTASVQKVDASDRHRNVVSAEAWHAGVQSGMKLADD